MRTHHPRLLCIVLVLVVVLAGVSTSPARADHTGKTPIHRGDTTDVAATGAAQPASIGGTTLVLLGVLLAGAILVRRVVQQRSHSGRRAAQSPVTLLGKHPVDGELTVRLLQIGPRVLVVGSTPQGLATLMELTDPEEIAALTGAQDSPGAATMFTGRVPIGGTPGREAPSVDQPRRSTLRSPVPAGDGT